MVDIHVHYSQDILADQFHIHPPKYRDCNHYLPQRRGERAEEFQNFDLAIVKFCPLYKTSCRLEEDRRFDQSSSPIHIKICMAQLKGREKKV